MKTKRRRNLIIGLMIVAMLSVVSAFSYHGYTTSIDHCMEKNGNISEDNLGFLAITWMVTCEK